MKIHEYQAKLLLQSYGVPVPKGMLARSVDDARRIAQEIGGEYWIAKAQVHAGGRSLVGGVRIARSVSELAGFVELLLSKPLFTRTGGDQGQPVSGVLIEQPVEIVQELYLAMMIDRDEDRIRCIASEDGGVGFEQLISHEPSHLYVISADPVVGLQPYHCRQVAKRLGLTAVHFGPFTEFLVRVYRFFIENNVTSLEINPLAQMENDLFIAVDARVTIDNNALYRHENLIGLRDYSQEDPREVVAEQYGLSYVRLGGDIGCLVNGAGLAMATMDLIKLNRGEPANFMDVGGTVTVPRVSEALRVLFSEKQVKSILVNIFGGIVRCDIIAQGLVEAAQEMGMKVPIIVRFAGTNAVEGTQIIESSNLGILCIQDLNKAAATAVLAAQGKVEIGDTH